ncbi:Secreted protein hcp [Serratia fonticola]|jgi:type VI secretion system Hcp family effector|uniref:Hcp family type VI secretion system effector n=2 Tax=Serratia TaxID=613 RepID=UPI000945DC84|nr:MULTISPECIES: Hcp family type VI secretion system effector [Serratia]ATM75351.1 type VI secretion system tube protein Hcp [Serratia fonticola]CAI1724188.1 Secreted protein hcp [Serratia fonticola]CAI2161219.1 Secreted protein hcp [Serratia fonticola]
MSSIIYMSIKGKKQGLISAGCGTFDSIGNRYQVGHEDDIFVLSYQHLATRSQHVNHQPVIILKLIDKSSPLIAACMDNNEEIECNIQFLRTSVNGGLERYYSIRLGGATIVAIKCDYPHSINDNGMIPQEAISIKYRDITRNHESCSTGSYSFWDDRVY